MSRKSINYEYMDIKTIAELTGVNYRTLRRNCQKGKYEIRKTNSAGGKSGLKYEILVRSLEYELQQKIFSNTSSVMGNPCLQNFPISSTNSIQMPALNKSEILPNNMIGGFSFMNSSNKALPENVRKLALAKYDIVADWQDYRNEKPNKKVADNNYVFAFNKGFIAEELLNISGQISVRSLYRWKKILEDNNDNYLSLIDNYKYIGESELNTSLSDIEKQEFIKLYYNDSKLDIANAYNLLKLKMSKQGIEIHSISTFRRFVSYIRRNHKDFEVLSREGEKALKDKVAPFNRRDLTGLNAGDVFVADGNKLDFMVINPYTGKPARAIWVVFFDWISFDVAGYEIMLTENTQNISSALRNAIIRLGRIPKKVYMDNGRAFRGTYFKGCKDLNHCGFKGIYKNLGIEEFTAKPYNGRTKIVERFFRDFVKSCPPLVSSYTGSSIANKPAHLNRNENFHKELHKNDTIPTIEQAKQIIETWLNEFHRKRPCPNDKTRTIGEVFESGKGEGVNIDMLDELMMSECIRTARRNTIKLFGLEYESADLYGLDDKFIIKYSLFDISQIKIYSLKGQFIGIAKPVVPVKAFVKDGNAVDIYNYRLQQKQYSNMLKNTINKTKSLISTSNPFENLIETKDKTDNKENKTNKSKKLEITCYENAHLFKQEERKYMI